MQTQKKQWIRPQLRPLELGEARERMEKALSLIEANSDLETESPSFDRYSARSTSFKGLAELSER